MMQPEPDWKTVPQGPPQPPEDIFAVLNEGGRYEDYSVPADLELVKMAMLTYNGQWGVGGKGVGVYTAGYELNGAYQGCMGSGTGKVTWADGLLYNGGIQTHKLDGRGKYTYPNGDTYEGEVADGVRHGHGTYTKASSGESYTGDWTFGVKNGTGKMQYSPVSYYEGSWLNGKPHGQGTMVYPTKSSYSGSWYEGNRHGRGVMKWVKDGNVTEKYDGMWKHGNMEGDGTHWYFPKHAQYGEKEQSPRRPNANYYSGGFKASLRHGKGAFVYTDGSRYEGQWANNAKHGDGTFLYDTGIAYSGEFRQDKPVSAITIPDKPALSRYIPLSINDLLVGEADKERVLNRVHMLLSRNYQILHTLFNQYAALNLEQEKRTNHFTALSMLQFWKLAKDTSLLGPGVSLAAIDRIFLRFHDSQGGSALTASKPMLEPLPPRGVTGLTASGLESADQQVETPSRVRHLTETKSVRSAADGHRRRSARNSLAGDGIRKTSMSRKVSGQSSQFPSAKTHKPSYRKDLKAPRTNIHAGSSYMYFREFVEAVIRIAHLKFSPFPQLSLADKLALCFQNDLQVTQGMSFLSELTEAEATIALHRPRLLRIYGIYTRKAYKGLPLHRTQPTYDAVLTLRQFLTLCKDTGIIGPQALPMSCVLTLFETPYVPLEAPVLEPTAEQTGLAPFPPKGGRRQRIESIATLSGFEQSFVFEPGEMDRMTERSRTPDTTHRGEEGYRHSISGKSDTSNSRRELEQKLHERKQHLQGIIRGRNDSRVVSTVKVEQELIFEEFVAALVKVAKVKYEQKNPADAFAQLLEDHLLHRELSSFCN